uniref:Aminopeptidase P N-terminal domain-containing protein n=1 Tax=Parascaris equorum TaxID=6256 RepID=A0A914R7A9_PAREQ
MWGVVRRFTSMPLRCQYSAWSQSPIEANEYIERRRRLVERIRQAAPKESAQRPLLIVARSAKEQFSAPDVPYPFRQCSYFRRSANEELWQGPAMTTPEITAISGIDEVKRHIYLQSDLETQIPRAVVSFDPKQFAAKSEQLAE